MRLRRCCAYVDRDPLGHQRRVMRHVVRIAHQQLQRVRSRRQFDHSLRLAEAEMQVVAVVGDRLVQWRHRRIDQQVMMTGVAYVVTPAGATPKLRVPNQILMWLELTVAPSSGQPI